MEFPAIEHIQTSLVDELTRQNKVSRRTVRVIASPYRICPLGAHIDHQGGPVLGMTINACTLMAYSPTADSTVGLASRNYPGKVAFDLDAIPENPGSYWGVYARAAALALKEDHVLTSGVTGLLDGMLPGCGLSSSASVLLAYLHALADVNALSLTPWDYVNYTRRAENKFIGLNNGILDQTSIVFGKRRHLLHIDTLKPEVESLAEVFEDSSYRILVAYSGYSRELTTTGYNFRVQECAEAAAMLAALAGRPAANMLSAIRPSEYDRFAYHLPPILARRAHHFFSETRRVYDGLEAWRQGDLDQFGRLMLSSCRSSIEQYECGSPAIHDLQQIVSRTRGVIGSRFSGGGFGGCVVGLVEQQRAAEAVETIAETYRRCHPEVEAQAAVYLARSADGVHLL
jgi:galactokinase/galacturonokinase